MELDRTNEGVLGIPAVRTSIRYVVRAGCGQTVKQLGAADAKLAEKDSQLEEKASPLRPAGRPSMEDRISALEKEAGRSCGEAQRQRGGEASG